MPTVGHYYPARGRVRAPKKKLYNRADRIGVDCNYSHEESVYIPVRFSRKHASRASDSQR